MNQKPTQREKDIWRAALTLANNICVQASDRHNDDDEILESKATAACAKTIREWLEIGDEQLQWLFAEANVTVERDFLGDALNSFDGVYRP